VIGIIFEEDLGLAEAIAIANKTQKANWVLLRKLNWSKGRTIYWLISQ
jgi:hypothetical protein